MARSLLQIIIPIVLLLAGQQAQARTVQPQDDLLRARLAMAEARWDRAIKLLSAVIAETPEHLEARYLRGISYGERGKHPTHLDAFFPDGARDFEFILARDSLFRDVRYQYARLRHFEGAYAEAIRLGEAQIRQKPDLVHAHIGLFYIYWRFILEEDPIKARRWLDQHATDHARFFKGTLRRHQRWYRGADEIFSSLQTTSTLSPSMVLLARARTYYAWRDDARAQGFLEQAIDAIQTEVDARYVFEDIKHISSPRELAAFEDLTTANEFRHFLRAFWTSRNPMPAGAVNARITEHYRRLRRVEEDFLFYGFRSWYNNPYPYEDEDFPETYDVSSDFDDRGILYLRHGAPDEMMPRSWLYRDPTVVFFFAGPEGGGTSPGNLRLVPYATDDIQDWGTRLLGRDFVEAERNFQRNVHYGLTTDTHSWPEHIQPIDLSYTVAAFRGEGGKTLLEVYYSLPSGELTRAQSQEDAATEHTTVAIEVGLALHDLEWQQREVLREVKHLPPAPDRRATTLQRISLDVTPDWYHMALHGRALHAPRLQSYRFTYRVPPFGGSRLLVSDLLLADRVVVTDAPGPFAKGDLHIYPNPSSRFSNRQPIFIYFELYGLRPTQDGQTRYSISYTLTEGTEDEPTAGDVALSLSTEALTGTNTSPIEYTELDVSQVPPGTYVLTVTIKDESSGQTVERSRSLTLTK